MTARKSGQNTVVHKMTHCLFLAPQLQHGFGVLWRRARLQHTVKLHAALLLQKLLPAHTSAARVLKQATLSLSEQVPLSVLGLFSTLQ